MKAIIYFSGDPSVGISSYSFEAEIPDAEMDDKEYREEVREMIKKHYTELDGEYAPQMVYFSDENQNDDQDF